MASLLFIGGGNTLDNNDALYAPWATVLAQICNANVLYTRSPSQAAVKHDSLSRLVELTIPSVEPKLLHPRDLYTAIRDLPEDLPVVIVLLDHGDEAWGMLFGSEIDEEEELVTPSEFKEALGQRRALIICDMCKSRKWKQLMDVSVIGTTGLTFSLALAGEGEERLLTPLTVLVAGSLPLDTEFIVRFRALWDTIHWSNVKFKKAADVKFQMLQSTNLYAKLPTDKALLSTWTASLMPLQQLASKILPLIQSGGLVPANPQVGQMITYKGERYNSSRALIPLALCKPVPGKCTQAEVEEEVENLLLQFDIPRRIAESVVAETYLEEKKLVFQLE
eukprot:TRINITY_DN27328_c0_g1_i1.p1 TRINITY_DN27328_c0_g1~~TRINITY_DN27328_c0_g1_i1.p1  ORF type:complete len:335 (-),score=52.43 TRINITY_DN27328_c0_g1_i1:70-1074(-)